MKRCFICKKRKALSEFYAHPRMKDGHLNKCKECQKAALRADRLDLFKRAEVLAKDSARAKTQKRKAYALEAQRKRRAKYPEKDKARRMIKNLARLPCEICGDPKSEAHHDDYSKPLEIRWLCFKHHRELMHKQKAGA